MYSFRIPNSTRNPCKSREPCFHPWAFPGAGAAGVFYNYSQALPCFNPFQGVNPETQEDGNFWGFQWCTEQFQQFARGGGGCA